MTGRVTRLAPSPTGALHLGNARTFLVNWVVARQRGWKIVLRVEDLDGPRVKRGADREAIEDLKWLGLDWDEGPFYQSGRTELYREALDPLVRGGFVYPCVCTRKEVEAAASAPHAEDGAAVYPGTCRGKYASMEAALADAGRPGCWRFAVNEGVMEFDDAFAGVRRFDVKRELGDFVVSKADGTPGYQMAVVVDDAAMGVTDVVRGDDLLDSTPRQMLVYRALGWAERTPTYCHVPLVVGTDGKRLAKRHGDTRISSYRERGVAASHVTALLAQWCGVGDGREGMAAADLVKSLDLGKIPREPIVFGEAEDRWLLAR